MSCRRKATGRRIAILVPHLRGGGAERKALAIASGLLRRGHEVDLVLRRLICDYPNEVPRGLRLFYIRRMISDPDSQKNLAHMATVPRSLTGKSFRVRYTRLSLVATLLSNSSWDLIPLAMNARLSRWAAGIAAYLDRERPDALLAMLTPSVVAATMAARLARHRVRTVGTLHNKVTSKRWLRRGRRAYPHADAAVGVSRGVASELAKRVGVPVDRVHTIYNPVVSEGLVRNSSQPAGHPWLDKPGPPVILAAGRLSRQKDFPTLFTAFARLRERCPARLIVLGKGRLQAELLGHAQRLGISEHLDLPGFVQNPYAFMAKASLFVLSSRHEGLPTVLIEAMACGCPVVSTDCPFGPTEILEGGRWGELVPVGDAKALSEAMLRTLENPPSNEAVRKRASFFGIEQAVARYEELLLGGT